MAACNIDEPPHKILHKQIKISTLKKEEMCHVCISHLKFQRATKLKSWLIRIHCPWKWNYNELPLNYNGINTIIIRVRACKCELYAKTSIDCAYSEEETTSFGIKIKQQYRQNKLMVSPWYIGITTIQMHSHPDHHTPTAANLSVILNSFQNCIVDT